MSADPRTPAEPARRLLAAATPGPWDRWENCDGFGQDIVQQIAQGEWIVLAHRVRNPATAELIAAAPTLIAELADENDRLRAERDTLADLHYLNGYHDAMMKAARMILAAPTSTHGSRQCDGPGAIPRVADHAMSADGDPQQVWNTYALRDFALSLIDRELEALGFADPNEDTHDD